MELFHGFVVESVNEYWCFTSTRIECKIILIKDLYRLETKNESAEIANHFLPFWDELRDNGKPSFLKHVISLVWVPLIGMSLILIVDILNSVYVVQLLMNQAILYLKSSNVANDDQLYIKNGIALTFLFLASQVIEAVLASIGSNIRRRVILMMDVGLIGLAYKKSFRLSPNAKQKHNAGQILTIVNVDCPSIAGGISQMEKLWAIPTRFIFASTLLIMKLGVPAIYGIAMALSSILVLFGTGGLVSKVFGKVLAATDARVNCSRENILGIKVIKYRGMQDYFIDLILKARNVEYKALKNVGLVLGLTQSYGLITQTAIPIIVFSVY